MKDLVSRRQIRSVSGNAFIKLRTLRYKLPLGLALALVYIFARPSLNVIKGKSVFRVVLVMGLLSGSHSLWCRSALPCAQLGARKCALHQSQPMLICSLLPYCPNSVVL